MGKLIKPKGSHLTIWSQAEVGCPARVPDRQYLDLGGVRALLKP